MLNKNSKLLRSKLGEIQKVIQETTTVLYGLGYDSYGGRTGRDMIEIISGLLIAANPQVIGERVEQLHIVGQHLRREYQFPLVIGAHALYVAADKILHFENPTMCAAEYLNSLCLAATRIRGCGLGFVLYAGELLGEPGNWHDWKNSSDLKQDSLRWAIPREQYSTDFLLRMICGIGKAFQEGLFRDIKTGFELKEKKTATDGFYHFRAKFLLNNQEKIEYRKQVADLNEICRSFV